MRSCFSIILLSLVPSISAGQSADEIKATILYVQSLQLKDGGFVAVQPNAKRNAMPQSSLRATSAAVRALKYLGGEVPLQEKTVKFVASCFDEKSGGFVDVPSGKPDVFLTAVGLMAVVELKMPLEPYASKGVVFLSTQAKGFEDIRIACAGFDTVKKFPDLVLNPWLDEIAKSKNTDGTYGTGEGLARQTGSVAALILRVGRTIDATERAKIITVLQQGQRKDGAYGKAEVTTSDLETTYRVMRAFHMLQTKPKEIEKLRTFVASCRNRDGGYGVEPGKPSNVGATYFASIIWHWLK